MTLKIAILHTRTKLGAKRTNMRRLEELINRTMIEHEVDIIYLPAFPLTGPVVGYYPSQKIKMMLRNFSERLSENDLQQNQTFMAASKWAHEFGVYVISGPIIERAGPRLYLTMFMSDPQGELAGKYRKIAITKHEEENGLTPGKSVGVFHIRRKSASIGVFSDEDLGYPEIFRALSNMGSNVIIGSMLPYNSQFFKMKSEDELALLTLEKETIYNFLNVRAKETDLPIILVGGAVEGSSSNGYIAFMQTIIVEPDVGVVKEKIMEYEDLNLPMVVEIDTSNSKPRNYDPIFKILLKNICKKNERQ